MHHSPLSDARRVSGAPDQPICYLCRLLGLVDLQTELGSSAMSLSSVSSLLLHPAFGSGGFQTSFGSGLDSTLKQGELGTHIDH